MNPLYLKLSYVRDLLTGLLNNLPWDWYMLMITEILATSEMRTIATVEMKGIVCTKTLRAEI